MNILFLFQTAEHVRFRRRVELLIEEGVNAYVLAFERKSYPGKGVPCGYTSLGIIKHKNYLQRFLPFIKSIKTIRSFSIQYDVLYAFGLDMLLLGWVSTIGTRKSIKIVYEVGDIRNVLIGKGVGAKAFRWLERFLIKKMNLLVVTSEAFVTGYFNNIQRLNIKKYQVLENKIDRKIIPNFYINNNENHSRLDFFIGYFGVMRCARTWQILKRVAESNKEINIYLRGIPRGLEQFDEIIKKYSNIIYGGAYKSPDELAELYGCVDIVWACYPYQGKGIGNWQWAKTIRFYEACYFKKPMIVQAGTEDSKIVYKYDIGIIIDMSGSIDEILEQINNITYDDLHKWEQNLKNLPKEVYLYTNEHRLLLQKLS